MRGRGGADAPGRAGAEAEEKAKAKAEYAVGQVADSFGPGGAPAAPLARLFSAAAAPPVLVAVTGVSAAPRRGGGNGCAPGGAVGALAAGARSVPGRGGGLSVAAELFPPAFRAVASLRDWTCREEGGRERTTGR